MTPGLHRRHAARLALACVLVCLASAASPGGTNELSRGVLHVIYSAGDEALAAETLATLDKAIQEFDPRLPVGQDPIHVTICATQDAFRRIAGEYGMARVGGIAKSPQGIIIVKAPYLAPDGDFAGTLRHELIHVLLARNTDEANMPRWFDEGVAMVLSKELRWESGLRIARMYAMRRLIPYGELNFAFAPIGDETIFGDAYAQALSMTRYISKCTGPDRFWELVLSMKTIPFEDALRKYADLTPGTLYERWRRTLWKWAILTSVVSGFSIFQIGALLVILAYTRKHHHGRQVIRQWEEEENEPEVFSWDKLEEGPYPWEEEYIDDDEDRR